MDLKALLKDILEDKTTEVYRGTISEELLNEMNKARKDYEEARDAYEAEMQALWQKVYEELGISPEGDYSINRFTGRITEEVPTEDLEKDSEQKDVH